MADRSGGSDTYDSCDDATPNAAEEDPKPEDPNVVAAARALLALFAARLLMAGLRGARRPLRGSGYYL